jgi:ORF6N domain
MPKLKTRNNDLDAATQIHIIRGKKVIFDEFAAEIYAVDLKTFNLSIRRNLLRLPFGFMFRLNSQELKWLKTRGIKVQNNVSPRVTHVFTAQGLVMLSFILNSPIAIATSIKLIRDGMQAKPMVQSTNDLALAGTLENNFSSDDCLNLLRVLATINHLLK